MNVDTDITTISEACADFTVLYCLLHHHGFLFAAWYDPAHRLTVGCRRPGEKKWELAQPSGFWIEARQRDATVTEYDSHNYLTMAVDSDGYLHLSGNMHVDPLIYFRSARPLDIHSLRWTIMTGEREERTTYPLFFKDYAGRLLFRYRDGCSGNGDDIYNIYYPEEQRWSRLLDTPLLNGEGLRNGYARLPVAGTDGYWHMVWMWRESPHCETNNNLSYARSRDLQRWETSSGQPLSLPITRATGEIVDSAGVGDGLINMVQEVGFDHHGKPVLVYHRYDAEGRSQAYLARPDGSGGWQKRQISDWNFRWDFSGPGSIPPGVVLHPPRPVAESMLAVEWSTEFAGEGCWLVDAQTFNVVTTRPVSRQINPQLCEPCQNLHPQAEVQLIGAQNSDYSPQDRYWLRWESLPIFRDEPHPSAVAAGCLQLIELLNNGQ